MGIHLVERSFELRGPSGLGAAPRPDLIGPALSKLQGTLIDSVRMGFLHSSHARGKIPQVLRAAAEVRFVGMEGTGDESTILHFHVPRFGDVAAELFEQRQLWDDGPQPEQTAFDLLALSLGDVREGRDDSSRFDHALLNRFASYRTALNKGLDSIRVDGGVPVQASFDSHLVESADQLRHQTPPSRRVRISGRLDMLGVSRKVMGLYLEDGTPVTALWNADDFTGLSGYLGSDVLIEGLAVFRPSGKLLRVDADVIAEAGRGDSYFSTLPLPGVQGDYAAAAKVRPGHSPYRDLLGSIPADESDEEFARLVEEFS